MFFRNMYNYTSRTNRRHKRVDIACSCFYLVDIAYSCFYIVCSCSCFEWILLEWILLVPHAGPHDIVYSITKTVCMLGPAKAITGSVLQVIYLDIQVNTVITLPRRN